MGGVANRLRYRLPALLILGSPVSTRNVFKHQSETGEVGREVDNELQLAAHRADRHRQCFQDAEHTVSRARLLYYCFVVERCVYRAADLGRIPSTAMKEAALTAQEFTVPGKLNPCSSINDAAPSSVELVVRHNESLELRPSRVRLERQRYPRAGRYVGSAIGWGCGRIALEVSVIISGPCLPTPTTRPRPGRFARSPISSAVARQRRSPAIPYRPRAIIPPPSASTPSRTRSAGAGWGSSTRPG